MNTVKYYEGVDRLYKALSTDGAFLIVQDNKNRTNIMTIGWATVGVVWGKPMMTVFVRPVRYTYEFIENAKTFSVSVPSVGKLKSELALCGTSSGRMVDKIKQCGFKMIDGKLEGTKLIESCKLHYECEIVEKNIIDPKTLNNKIIENYYPNRDYHTVYYGEIKHVLDY